MTFGLVIYGSLQEQSGGFLYDRRLVRRLEARGHRVRVFALPWRPYAVCLADNLRLGFWRRLARAPLDALLQDELNHPSLALGTRWLRREVSYPVVGIVHHLRASEHRPAWQNALYGLVERVYLGGLDACIYNSATTRAVVERLAGPRLGVVAPPSGKRFGARVTPEAAVRRATRPGPLQVVAVGAVIPRKNLHGLLDTVVRLPQEVVHLRVIGRTDAAPAYVRHLRTRLAREGLTSRVTLTGALDDAALADALADAHVLAGPAYYEGYGIAYVEAMGFGLPVLATRRGAPREFVTNGQEGFLVDPDDPAALASHLHHLHADRDALARMSTHALTRFERLPTWPDSMDRVADFLEQLLTS